MSKGFTGACLCGAVRYESAAAPQIALHCHCRDCRRSSATGHATIVVVPESEFSLTGEVRFYDRPADSGNMVSRGFCPNCGSAIYARNSGMPGSVGLRASSLDDPEIVEPSMVVYTSRALSWDPVAPGLRGFAEMPVSAEQDA
ncbi:MAG: GFA family protein [Rhodomicrobiaceae bacterium]